MLFNDIQNATFKILQIFVIFLRIRGCKTFEIECNIDLLTLENGMRKIIIKVGKKITFPFTV